MPVWLRVAVGGVCTLTVRLLAGLTPQLFRAETSKLPPVALPEKSILFVGAAVLVPPEKLAPLPVYTHSYDVAPLVAGVVYVTLSCP
jgi:hypothetical protein